MWSKIQMHALLCHYTKHGWGGGGGCSAGEDKGVEDECSETVCRLLYQPPVALFTDINRLMTKYSSLCPKLSKYLDTQLPSVDVCDSERSRQDKSRNSGQPGSRLHTPTHADILLQGTVKYQGYICLHIQNSQGKMRCFLICSFIHTYRECSSLDGRKIGSSRASAGSNQTFYSGQKPPSLTQH